MTVVYFIVPKASATKPFTLDKKIVEERIC